MKYLYHVCPPVRSKLIHSLKLVDYLHVQADKPWYTYCLANSADTDEVLHLNLLSTVCQFTTFQYTRVIILLKKTETVFLFEFLCIFRRQLYSKFSLGEEGGIIKLDFRPYFGRYTSSPNENFEYGFPLSMRFCSQSRLKSGALLAA